MYRPVRGVIDLVLVEASGSDVVAVEIHSQLRRVEQQLRWAVQKADALAALPELEGRTVHRLLVLRNTAATREVGRLATATLGTAYPGRAADAVAALRGAAPWPGHAIAWADVARGTARVLDRPPRGVVLGR